MSVRHRNLVAETLIQPNAVSQSSMPDWNLLVRQANHARLLGRLYYVLSVQDVPSAPAAHLEAAYRVTLRQRRAVQYEVAQLQKALSKIEMPVVLLKGAAYVMGELPPADGRLFSDIDILVPKVHLQEVEQAMLLHGWVGTHHNAYDQRYYRTWMHEIPPLKHVRRQSVIDVHHAILPETCRIHPDSAKLMADIVPIEGYENLYRLSDVDIVLHSATHLFHEGEFEHGLRDLADLDVLLRKFSRYEDYWDKLLARAVELELGRPLYYALRYCNRFLQTPIPTDVIKNAEKLGQPNKVITVLMDALFGRALMPDHSSCDDLFTPLARWLLYVRSHYLRMPPHLLIPHLIRKAIVKRQGSVSLAGQALEKE